jgi:hypothetical protein
MKNIYAFLLLLFVGSVSHAGIVHGGMDSGGGSGYAAEFISMGRNLAGKLEKLKGFPLTPSQYLDIVQKTKVEFTNDNLGKDAVKSSASSSLIRVSRKFWKDARDLAKYQVIFHGYLMISGLDDTNLLWTKYALDGGKTLHEFKCSNGFLGDLELSVRWIDIDNDGQGDHFANTLTNKSLIFGSYDNDADTFETSQGLAFTWALMNGGIYFLIPNDSLTQNKPFKVKINKIATYDEQGTPLAKVTDSLSCKLVRP